MILMMMITLQYNNCQALCHRAEIAAVLFSCLLKVYTYENNSLYICSWCGDCIQLQYHVIISDMQISCTNTLVLKDKPYI